MSRVPTNKGHEPVVNNKQGRPNSTMSWASLFSPSKSVKSHPVAPSASQLSTHQNPSIAPSLESSTSTSKTDAHVWHKPSPTTHQTVLTTTQPPLSTLKKSLSFHQDKQQEEEEEDHHHEHLFELDMEEQQSATLAPIEDPPMIHVEPHSYTDRITAHLLESTPLASSFQDVKPIHDMAPSPSSLSLVNVPIHEFTSLDISHHERSSTLPCVPVSHLSQALGPGLGRIGLKDFELYSVIGRGAYGKVFLVRKKANSNQSTDFYAMKVLRKASLIIHQKDAEHTMNERQILEAIQHPFIVKLYYAFQTSYKLYLILGYAPGGELFSYLAKERMFTEDMVQFYASELVLALEHLHSLGIIYRDLKPENVLLAADGHVLLTDFGLSKVAIDGAARTVCGTAEFMAPEIIALDLYLDNVEKNPGNTKASSTSPPPYDKAVDYWSLGIMIFDMLTGSPPFTGSNRKKVMDGVLKKKLICPKYMTSTAKDVCTKLLKKQANTRLGSGEKGAEQVKAHAFFRGMDWVKVLNKEYPPPILPKISSVEDTGNFSAEFTGLPPVDTPPSVTSSQLLHKNDVQSIPIIKTSSNCSCPLVDQISVAGSMGSRTVDVDRLNDEPFKDTKSIPIPGRSKLENAIKIAKKDTTQSKLGSTDIVLGCGEENCPRQYFTGFSFVSESVLKELDKV